MRRLATALLVAGLLVAGLVTGCGTPEPSPSPSGCPVATGRAPVARVNVIERHPHDPTAFTQGLVFAAGTLYESTGLNGESSVRRVDLESGAVRQRVDLAHEYFGEGLALLDDRLYQLTWQNGIGFVYDVEDLQQVDTFHYEGEGWGLTTDGAALILSNGSSELRFIDPGSYEVLRTIEVTDAGDPVDMLNELEWIEEEIWANVWQTDRIARIDPESGRVLSWVDLTGLLPESERSDGGAVLNGIAHDESGDRIFVTGKLWPALFEVEVEGAATPRCG